MRLANLDKIDPEIVKKISHSLENKVQSIGDIDTQSIDGKAQLIEIMKNLDTSNEKSLLNELSIKDPELAEEIEEKLFNMDIVYRIPDKEFQLVLREWQDKEIALLLKGKTEKLKDRFMNNLSARRKDMIKLEYNTIGEVRKSEVDELEGEFLRSLRKMADSKKITILDFNDEYIS